jgi:3-methyladenine DNA glycosylase/8-oxoguanine DNA glycosylase
LNRRGLASPNRKRWEGAHVYTIGHSTRPVGELIEALRSADVKVLADIRTVPRSRRNPQFNRDALRSTLAEHGLRYEHLAKLGGLRRARKDSHNTGWRNASFRGYADYMQTADFEAGLEELRELTTDGNVALMCAEAVPWRCHRSLVSDVLTVRGAKVRHIIGPAPPNAHRLTAFAKAVGEHLTYPGGDDAASIRLATPAPFHLEATVRVLQRRPANAVEIWEEGRWLRAFTTTEGLVLAAVDNRGSIDAPDVRLSILAGASSAAAQRSLQQTVRTMLGLDVDPVPLRAAADRVPRLRSTAHALRGMRPPRFAGLFDVFANVVPFQQLSLEAGTAIVGRLVERFGEHVLYGNRRFAAAPTASSIAGARLSTLLRCGLSRSKAESLRSLAKSIDSGELTDETIAQLSTRDALRTLMKLPGIGPWSAAVVLLRGFGRLEVFPPGDSGAARGLNALLRLRTQTALGRVVERFGDCRGYLYFCGLGGSLLAKGFIHAAPESPAHASEQDQGVPG